MRRILNQWMALRLWRIAAGSHARAHWSDSSHFWSGFLGMLVNNCLVLGTIWAMIFAGRSGLREQSQAYACMTFVNMTAWGIIHLFFGGWTELDQQIDRGNLDSALMTPRSPIALTSLTKSHLPAWGDLVMGVIGLSVLAFSRFGFLFWLQSIVMVAFAAIAFGGIFIAFGSLGFWMRRSERVWSSLVMIVVSVNSYPVFDALGEPLKWLILFAPVTAVGVIPSRYLLHPEFKTLIGEAAVAWGLALVGNFLFKQGIKRYQSTPAFSGQKV